MRGAAIALLGAFALSACGNRDDTATTGKTAEVATNAPASPAGPTVMPRRKPGLWSHTVATGGATQAMKVCLDSDTDAKMSIWGQATSKDMCAKNAVSPIAGGWRFESECDLGGAAGKSTTWGTVRGDLSSSYVVEASSTTTGASMAQANGTHDMTLTARWEGPCPASMNGGDVQLPGGMTINMETLAAGR